MPGRVTVTIDGQEMQAEAGDLVIKVAQEHGIYIPRFCWHERMKPVGMCRMCLVEIGGQRGLPPACTATVTDGMVVNTQTPAVKKAQEGVLEFLLINHPLDCPVCDRGGECPLQDLTFGFGPGESRFVEEKRHFAKPIPISDLVLLDRERCILCARCTRFADEVAGDALISFVERSGQMQVLTFPDEPFSSYFSGNTVQICPVGALLATPYRFRARPWDLSSVESSCQLCAVGCRVALQSTSNRLVRSLGVDSEPINHGWLCDKGRFAFDFVHGPGRWIEPMITAPGSDGQGGLEQATWPEALDAAYAGLAGALERGGPESVAVIGGARGTNEDAYAWARLTKGVLRTDNIDCQLGDGLPAEVVAGLPRATLSDWDRARAVVLLGPDLKEELPVAYLRLRRAAEDLKVPVVEISAVDTGFSRYARVRLRHRPGEAETVVRRLVEATTSTEGSGDAQIDAAAALLRGAGSEAGDEPGVVVVLGRPSVAEPAAATVGAAALLRRLPGVRFLSALRRGNVHGALDLGLAPGVLPGRVALEAGAAWFEAAWGGVPASPGLDTEGILQAAADGRIEALVLLGADPVSDFPDRDLARKALRRVPFVVAVDAFSTPSSEGAHVVLPVALYGEKRGTATNLEGRLVRLARKVTPPGTAMEDWRVATELALRFGVDFDLEAVDEVTDEIARLAPAYRGADVALLRRAVDGVLVPVGEAEEPVLDGAAHVVSPQADMDPAVTGGPVESLVLVGGPASAMGLAASEAPSDTTPLSHPALPSGGSGAQPSPDLDPPPLLRWDGPLASTAGGPDLASNPGGPDLASTAGGPDLASTAGGPDLASTAGGPAGGDEGGLRLWAGRTLYDGGVMVSHSESVAALARPGVLRLHPSEVERLGLAAGALVAVASEKGTITLPVRPDAGVPPGVAAIPLNPPGPGAADLIDATSVSDVRVEAKPGPPAEEAKHGPPAEEAKHGPPAEEAKHGG